MMKIKPIITAISIAAMSASVGAFAATADNTRTLPVRTANAMPGLAQKVSLNVQENRSRSDGTATVQLNTEKTKPVDSMNQLINTKQDAQNNTPAPAADNMSAAELTLKDEQSDSTDDISEGQAVAAPSDRYSSNNRLYFHHIESLVVATNAAIMRIIWLLRKLLVYLFAFRVG